MINFWINKRIARFQERRRVAAEKIRIAFPIGTEVEVRIRPGHRGKVTGYGQTGLTVEVEHPWYQPGMGGIQYYRSGGYLRYYTVTEIVKV
jgi:hypothetical protein